MNNIGDKESFLRSKKFGRELQGEGTFKSLFNSPLGLDFSATMPKAKNQSF
jgi:hypothetical protein